MDGEGLETYDEKRIYLQRRYPKTMAGPHLFYHKIRWYIFERW